MTDHTGHSDPSDQRDPFATFAAEPAEELHTSTGGPRVGWRGGAITAVVAAGALAVAGVVGVALATGGSAEQKLSAGSSASSSATATDDGDGDNDANHPGRGMGDLGGIGALGGALHGEFVTKAATGTGYRTLDLQRGTASAVSATSITVRSADGFTQTYVVSSTTRSMTAASGVAGIKNGANVVVVAEKSSSALKALQVLDLSVFGKLRGHGPGGIWGDRGHDRRDQPAPSSTTSTQGTAYHA